MTTMSKNKKIPSKQKGQDVSAPAETPAKVERLLKDEGIRMRVPHALIDLNEKNRPFFKDKDFDDFVADIALNGVLQDVTLRTMEDGRYRVAGGERRVRASRICGDLDVPARCHVMTDAEERQVRYSENAKRTNPHPMEESMLIEEMEQDYKTDAEIAARLGKSESYVFTRKKLSKLIVPIREMVLAEKFNMTEAFKIAILSPESQQAFFDGECANWKKNEHWSIYGLDTALNRYRFDLSKAPFDRNDAKLHPKMGACTACPHNTACMASLFPEMESKSVCLNKQCFGEKIALSFKQKLAKALSEKKPASIISTGPLSKQALELMKEIEGAISLPRLEFKTITVMLAPSKPDKDKFWRYANMKRVLDEDAYKGAQERHQQEMEDFRKKISSPKIKVGVLVNDLTLEVVHYSPLAPNMQVREGVAPSAKVVEVAVKEGTATPELIRQRIQTLKDREAENQNKDRQAVHDKALEASRTEDEEKVLAHPLSDADLAIGRFLWFDRLETNLAGVFLKRLFPNEKKTYEISNEKIYQAFQTMTKEDEKVLLRYATSSLRNIEHVDTKDGYFYYHWLQSVGLDVSVFEKEQATIATKRKGEVETKIKELQATLHRLEGKSKTKATNSGQQADKGKASKKKTPVKGDETAVSPEDPTEATQKDGKGTKGRGKGKKTTDSPAVTNPVEPPTGGPDTPVPDPTDDPTGTDQPRPEDEVQPAPATPKDQDEEQPGNPATPGDPLPAAQGNPVIDQLNDPVSTVQPELAEDSAEPAESMSDRQAESDQPEHSIPDPESQDDRA